MKTETIALLGAGTLGAIYLMSKQNAVATVPASALPGGTFAAAGTGGATATTLPVGFAYDTAGNPISNYNTQIAAGLTEVSNRNHQLSDTEATQYAINYPDLQEEIANLWKGGLTKENLQKHWTTYGHQGVSKSLQYGNMPRTYLTLYPLSTTPWYPAKGQLGYDGNTPWQGKSLAKTGSGLFGTILKAVTIGAGAVLTVASAGTAAPLIAAGESGLLGLEGALIHGVSDKLSPKEKAFIFTAAAVINQVLPMYQGVDNMAVNKIKRDLDIVLNYSL